MNLLRRKKTDKPWDDTFSRWIETGRAEGIDPNDVGDREWDDPRAHVEATYHPHIRPGATVLELGPGTGRITRHVIGRCGRMVLVDYSQTACDWLKQYLKGRGAFEVHCITKPTLAPVASASIDFLFAFGVFEHIGPDDLSWFLDEFHRVLKPGAVAVFNFDNIMSPEGLAWHRRWRLTPGHRNIFRFYHPDVVARLARAAGLAVAIVRTNESRHAEIELAKP